MGVRVWEERQKRRSEFVGEVQRDLGSRGDPVEVSSLETGIRSDWRARAECRGRDER